MAQRTLCDSARDRLEDLPHFMRDDPQVQGYVDALSRELDRVEALIVKERTQWFPTDTTDDALLRIWEFNLGLPVATPGLAPEQRALLIATHIRKRKSAAGSDWLATLNQAFGTGTWSYDEDYANYQVRLVIPYGSSTLTALGVLALAREITPAHLDIVVAYDGGGGGGSFIVGISLVGIGVI